MTAKLIPKKTVTPGKIPSPSDLELGELGVNFEDGVVYGRHPSGVIVNLTGAKELHQHSISQITSLQDELDSKVEEAPVDGKVYARKDSQWVEAGGTSSGGMEVVYTDVNYAASPNQYIFADTSNSEITITLPPTPTEFDRVVIADSYGRFAFNNLTIIRNGSTIQYDDNNLVLDKSYRELSLTYYDGTWNAFVQSLYRWPLPNAVAINGVKVGNESDTITLFIVGYDAAASYNITVSGGSFTRTSDAIFWTLPNVSRDADHFIQVEQSNVTGTTYAVHEVQVLNIPVMADDSISVTDFSFNSSNDGWTF